MDGMKTVRVEKGEGIAWVFLNRPEKRNAMSPTLHFEMDAALAQLETDPEVRCVVVTGAGESFSAGQDLKEFFRELDGKPAEAKRAAEAANRWRWDRLYNYDKPTIAMVNGFCVGGAFMQLIACDFAVAAEDAKFSLSEINWGIIPGGLVARVMTEALGYRDALDLCLTGRAFDGREAVRLRLVNEAVPKEALRERTTALAQLLMSKDPEAYRATKIAVRRVRAMSFEQAYDYLGAKMEELRQRTGGRAQREGIAQFVDQKTYKPIDGSFAHGQ
ncbi:p-hydroxycinnamoyl CoA hydratase/lyase [Roseomonas harenae]|uniref:p-hydroxycinnamoyl CoA hydratase/lyase n=1 Tax=Muricoccus harenae TaxID=2692566 RepID=UPI0013319BB6|nr:p-hydroxycinnamoyl CoA hydratase/lyase [Roseomonas harenae]